MSRSPGTGRHDTTRMTLRSRLASLPERRPYLFSTRVLLGLVALIATALTLHGLPTSPTAFNNFAIFRDSFRNLLLGIPLYVPHPTRHVDLFKYSPTFAIFMAPFWLIPRAPGVVLWNLLNALAPCWAVSRLNLDARAKAFVILFSLVELQTTLHSAQSNGLIAATMIGAFAALERNRVVEAALFLALGVTIKPFAAVAGLLFVFYPRKGRFLAAGTFSTLVLGLLPASILGITGLLSAYREWFTLLAHDRSHEANYSLATLLESTLGLRAPDVAFVLPGVVFLILPLARRTLWQTPGYRLMVLAGMLIWVVIFNHKAESPTYIIAVLGVGLWAMAEPRGRGRTLLLVFVFLLTEASSTDLFPRDLRMRYLQPYSLKALPCVAVWLALTWRLLTGRRFATRLSA